MACSRTSSTRVKSNKVVSQQKRIASGEMVTHKSSAWLGLTDRLYM